MDPCQPVGDQAFRRQDPYGRWPEMTYGGALSFLRRPYTRNLQGVDIAVMGIPFDGAVTYRPGARLGPRAIRAASVSLAELKAFPFGFDPFTRLSVVDYGDCFLDPHHPDGIVGTIEREARAILDTGTQLVSLGGDHFVTYPLLRAHTAVHGPLALVHFDAHSDTWDDDGCRVDHGTMFARAVQEGLVDVARSVQLGIRTHNDRDYGFRVLTAPWIHREGPGKASQVVRDRVGAAPCYVTIDVDCMDPAFAPGTGTPVVGGLSSSQFLEILRGLNGLKIIGADIVEVAPAYDVSDITALLAATAAHDCLCLMAADRPEYAPPRQER
ncbi:agmatinase [Haematospirillum jordaniae]|uniref:Agmatinase n=1 Tax=Haematospirillum jordaniae TaxID=1549855 RepID=A0A143DGY2_9PROT|nr:agmatinase [Haematospirillum jordaniae]AMW35800.1 agmatinase [Haematospirillum jordaniae]NKD45670.1 agmatinase [Haematospirillum jordaniae]NKD57773.1 agmatinase [Haematospirillum jordaniae]NKD59741.1 agmatinase [Haematospirillum jordaniae]NKD67601.1 agmatinase [Haematospirillum jordaniae]